MSTFIHGEQINVSKTRYEAYAERWAQLIFMERFTIIFIIIFYSVNAFSQGHELAIINDPDGNTNVRSGPGTDHEVIQKVFKNELFLYVDKPSDNWLKIFISKDNYQQISGFIHKSRVQDLKTVKINHIKNLVEHIFNKELDLYNSYKANTDKRQQWTAHHEFQFDEILDSFVALICDTEDLETFNLFNKIILKEEGSADELPAFAIGEIFNCKPEWTLKNIPKSKNYYDQLEWGFVNSEQFKNEKLRDQLNNYRQSIGLEIIDFDSYEY